MVRRRGRGARGKRRRATRQFLVYPFCLNIVQGGAHSITASSLGIPSDRPARVVWCSVQYLLQKDPSVTDAAQTAVISVALRDGNGETDARSRVYLVGPTVGRLTVRARPGVDFDHYGGSDTPFYVNVTNFPTAGFMTLNGRLGVEFQDANVPSPVTLTLHPQYPAPSALPPRAEVTHSLSPYTSEESSS